MSIGTLHNDAAAEHAQLREVLAPRLQEPEITARLIALRLPPVPPYRIDAWVRPGEYAAGDSAADIRRDLLIRAESALEALDDAGWQLTACPRMEFSGELDYATVTLGGELFEPAKQHSISLKVQFEVTRAPRPTGPR